MLGTEPHNEGSMLEADYDDEEERKRKFIAGIDVEGLEGDNADIEIFGLRKTTSFQEGADRDVFV